MQNNDISSQEGDFPDFSTFDKSFSVNVEQPWLEFNKNADFPWNAPSALKNNWINDIHHSEDPIVRLVSALGLARSNGLTPDEFFEVEKFFSVLDVNIADSDVVIFLLVTGASVPSILWQTLFFPWIEQTKVEYPDPLLGLLVGWFLRSSSQVEMAQTILSQAESFWSAPIYRLLVIESFLNPLSIPPASVDDKWLNAMAAFHPSNKCHGDYSLDPLSLFGDTLRWDKNASKKSILLPTPFNWAYNARRNHSSLAFDDSGFINPSRKLLEFFNQPGHIFEVWRYYYPLFNWPWSSPVIPYPNTPAEALALAVVGHPPLEEWLPDGVGKASVESLISRYPALSH